MNKLEEIIERAVDQGMHSNGLWDELMRQACRRAVREALTLARLEAAPCQDAMARIRALAATLEDK